jgi:hypothetical protein
MVAQYNAIKFVALFGGKKEGLGREWYYEGTEGGYHQKY